MEVTWNHSFMVFIIIPMIYQVDRARRKEVAVKVKESKDYTFRDEVRSSGMIEFMRNFSWSVYHYQLNGRGDALALCSTVAAFLTNSKTSDLGWSWWVFEEGPGARLPTPEHCGKAKNDCWKGVNFIFGNPPERWKKISLRDCSPIFPCRRSWWKLMSAGCRNR